MTLSVARILLGYLWIFKLETKTQVNHIGKKRAQRTAYINAATRLQNLTLQNFNQLFFESILHAFKQLRGQNILVTSLVVLVLSRAENLE